MPRSAYDYALDMILGNQIDDYTLQGFQRLSNNADVLEDRKFTLLHQIILRPNTVNISSILSDMLSSTINDADAYGQTALCWAAIRGDVECTKLLLQHNANPNIIPEKGLTVLQSAAQSGSYACIELLLRAGAEVDFQGAAKMTALQVAVVRYDNVEIVNLLIQYGVTNCSKSI